jgi:hypothetical protein
MFMHKCSIRFLFFYVLSSDAVIQRQITQGRVFETLMKMTSLDSDDADVTQLAAFLSADGAGPTTAFFWLMSLMLYCSCWAQPERQPQARELLTAVDRCYSSCAMSTVDCIPACLMTLVYTELEQDVTAEPERWPSDHAVLFFRRLTVALLSAVVFVPSCCCVRSVSFP